MKLWERFVRFLLPRTASVRTHGSDSWSATIGNRKISFFTFPECGSVQRNFFYLDQPQWKEVTPSLSVQNNYSFSTRPPSIFEAWRIRRWLAGKIENAEHVG